MFSFQNLADWCKSLVCPGRRVGNDDLREDTLQPKYRWPIRRDVPQLVELDRLVAAQPWGASEFIAHLSRRDCVGWVAGLQHSDAIVGSVLYEFCKDHFKICKLSVNPDFIELGIACHLLEHVQRKLISSETRWRIDAVVDEQELTTLQHFKAAGFTAIDVYQDYFKSEHGTCDGFLFTFDRDDAKKKFSVSLEQLNWWRGLVGSGKE